MAVPSSSRCPWSWRQVQCVEKHFSSAIFRAHLVTLKRTHYLPILLSQVSWVTQHPDTPLCGQRNNYRSNNYPPSPSQPESTDDQADWLEVTPKRPVKQALQRPPNDTQPRVPRNQCIIVHGLPEIRADRVAQETRYDIEKLSAVVKAVVPLGEQIVILKTQRLCPRGTNPSTSPRPLRVVVSDQAARDLLVKSRFRLCNPYPKVYFYFGRTKKEREKLAKARHELKARREKGERELIIQCLIVVQIRRTYLWRDPFSPSPQSHRQRVKTQLGIAMFNAGSLMNKLDELNNLASLSHIDIIGVTLTWPHDEIKDHEVSLPGYVLFRQDRPSSKRGEGVALYVKSNLRPQLMSPPLPTPSSQFLNIIACELLSKSEPKVLVL